jgi:peptide/nickel transport system substrate-binding protein
MMAINCYPVLGDGSMGRARFTRDERSAMGSIIESNNVATATEIAGERRRPVRGGSATWALTPGFPPTVVLPFTPASEFGQRNLFEFQILMYRPLYWCGRDGQPEVDYDLSLAEPPEWSEDGRTVTVTIKPWVWSNGNPIDADSVLLWMHLFEVNKEQHGGYVPGLFPDNLVSYRKVADNRVSFTFDRAYSHRWVLMNQLSLIVPMPREWDRTADGPANATHDIGDARAVYEYLWEQNLDRASFQTNPLWQIVSGPWKIKSYQLDGRVTFVPNERYSGPNKPMLDEFTEVPTVSDEAEYAMLQRGPRAADGVQVGFLPFDYITEPTADPTKGGPNPLAGQYKLVPQTVFGIHYFPINQNNPVVGPIFRQLYFRQALQSLIDQDAAIREAYQGYGYRTDGPIPTLPDTDLVSPSARNVRYPFSISAARDLLTAHGWDLSTTPATCVDPDRAGPGIAKGAKLSLNLDFAQGHPTLVRIMAKLKADAAQAGIEITLGQRPGIEIAGQVAPCKPSAATPCMWQMSSWNGGWVYGPGFHPTGEFQFRTGAGVNWGSYSDPHADDLIDRTVTSDAPHHLHAYQDYIAEQLPVMFMPNFPLRLLEVAENLDGVEPLNPYGILTPENWYYVDGD